MDRRQSNRAERHCRRMKAIVLTGEALAEAYGR